MLSLDKVVAGAKVRGLAGAVPVEVLRTEWIGADALNVVYRGADGPAEVLLFRDAEPRLELVQATRAFSFDGDGEAFRIASEAQRIRLAHLFDPTSPSTARGLTRCRTRSQPSTVKCCRVNRCGSCLPTTLAPARPSWRAF
jgi:hypothetical protein